MTLKVCGHSVERLYGHMDLAYKCADCGLTDELIQTFDQYSCPPK